MFCSYNNEDFSGEQLLLRESYGHYDRSESFQLCQAFQEESNSHEKKEDPTVAEHGDLSLCSSTSGDNDCASEEEIIFEAEVISLHKRVLQGYKDDTMELNINFKTLLGNYFKERVLLNELNEFETQQVNDFLKRRPSFHSLLLFYKRSPQNANIRDKCEELLSSAECIRRILNSRCKMHTKIQMVKFV